jgi:hypothetical protein
MAIGKYDLEALLEAPLVDWPLFKRALAAPLPEVPVATLAKALLGLVGDSLVLGTIARRCRRG